MAVSYTHLDVYKRQAEKDAAAKQASKVTLDNLFAKMQEGEMKELNLIVKADVQGSACLLYTSCEKVGARHASPGDAPAARTGYR